MDSTLTLAFNMQKNPGVYTLLLGSGISSSAGILTGWQITQDLISQIEAIGGGKFDENARYDDLLKALGKTKAERNAIMRSYFEPSEADRETGKKMPTDAYWGIAKLIGGGYIKVVLTTNFDDLLESAIKAVTGISPDIISSDDMINGAVPIRHSNITVIKLHGDYRDTRTLNTYEELEVYSDEKNKLLDSIFDEYGLVVCGWSATWDAALRDAIYRAKSRRYSAYWIDINESSEEAQTLIHHLHADFIRASADKFFSDLQNKVEALEKINREHPLTVQVAVERVKKLNNTNSQNELSELLWDESQRAYKRLVDDPPELPEGFTNLFASDQIKTRLNMTLSYIEILLNILNTVCRYGRIEQEICITRILMRWSSAESVYQRKLEWQKMSSLLFIYTGGISALYNENWVHLRCLLLDPKPFDLQVGRAMPILYIIDKRTLFGDRLYQDRIYDHDPGSKVLKEVIRPFFQDSIPLTHEFDQLFDLFEVILALISINSEREWWIEHDAALREYTDYKTWAHIIEFWRNGGRQRNDWGFLIEFFDRDRDKLVESLQKYYQIAIRKSRQQLPSEFPDYSIIYSDVFSNDVVR